MKKEQLEKLFTEHKTNELVWDGICHDCQKPTTVVASISETGIEVSNGAVYEVKIAQKKEIFIKCQACFDKNAILRNWQPTQVFSRVVGYLLPVSQWNGAKKSEFGQRKTFTNMQAA